MADSHEVKQGEKSCFPYFLLSHFRITFMTVNVFFLHYVFLPVCCFVKKCGGFDFIIKLYYTVLVKPTDYVDADIF